MRKLLTGQEPNQEPVDHDKVFSAFMFAICGIIGFILLVFLFLTADQGTARAQEINPDMLANAIYHAENSPKYPYGILAHYKHTTPRQACLNTIRNRLRAWNGQGDFIVFLGKTYSPPTINPNWVRLVKYFLRKENK